MGSHRGCASRPAGLGACSCSRSSAPSGCAGCSPQAPGVSLTTMRSSTRKYGLGTHTCLAHAGRLRACPTCCGSRPRCRPRRCCARRCCACTQRGADARFAQCSAAPTAQGKAPASAASTCAGSQRPGWFDRASRTKPVAGHTRGARTLRRATQAATVAGAFCLTDLQLARIVRSPPFIENLPFRSAFEMICHN